jgi:hypothetical protein
MSNFKFKSANLIEVFEDVEEITKLLLNLLKFGGECNINVCISKQTIPHDVSKLELDRATDLVKITKLIHGIRKRNRDVKTDILLSLARYPRYNYITKELLYNDSPAVLAVSSGEKPISIIKLCVNSKNMDMFFELLKYIPIKTVMSNFDNDFRMMDQIDKIIMSGRLYEFLEYIGKNKDEIIEILVVDKENFHCFEEAVDLDKPAGEDEDEGGGNASDDDGDGGCREPEFTDPHSTMYAYYMFKHTHKQIGKKIHKINSLFYRNQEYELDQAAAWFTIEQIKRLNELGFVIGKYFYFKRPSTSKEHAIMKKDIKPVVKVNAYIKERNEMNLHALRVSNHRTRDSLHCALKYALIDYRQNKETSEDKIEYLLKLILDQKDDHKLFIPEIIWIMSKYFPFDHKLMKLLLPNDKAMKDFILFEDDYKINPRVGQSAFKNYYDFSARSEIWSSMAKVIVDKEFLLNGVLGQCEEMIPEDHNTRECLILASHTCVSLMKACFELGKGKILMEKIVRKATMSR